MIRSARRRLLPVVLLSQVAAGCALLPPRQPVEVALPTRALPSAQVVLGVDGLPQPRSAAPTPANGSIYRTESYRPLFENHRARLVGDIVTVQIAEKVSATARSTSQVDRSSGVDAKITSLPVIGAAAALARLGAGGSTQNTFGGKGTTENSADFAGTITATVVHVLPNGHLIVAGEKQVGINATVDVLRFSGQVDPRSIQPGNVVASTQIANVRVEQGGRGAQAEVQHVGWLARFFSNVSPL